MSKTSENLVEMQYVCPANTSGFTVARALIACECFQCQEVALCITEVAVSALSFQSIFITLVGKLASNQHGYKAIIHS